MVSMPSASAAFLAFSPRTGVVASSADGTGAPAVAGSSVRGVVEANRVGGMGGLSRPVRRRVATWCYSAATSHQ